MPDNANNLETALKNSITVEFKGDTYTFKIPSVKDRIRIAAKGLELRSEALEANKKGIAMGYDPVMQLYTDTIATFIILLNESSAKWPWSTDGVGQPVMDLDKWPDDVPVMEVVDQFNSELAKFRETGN